MNAAHASGRPLDGSARRAMEARFGYDFSAVRTHDDARAATAAIDAAAFTVGEDVACVSGRYDPRSAEGRRLLSHEFSHVVRQRRGSKNPKPGRRGGGTS